MNEWLMKLFIIIGLFTTSVTTIASIATLVSMDTNIINTIYIYSNLFITYSLLCYGFKYMKRKPLPVFFSLCFIVYSVLVCIYEKISPITIVCISSIITHIQIVMFNDDDKQNIVTEFHPPSPTLTDESQSIQQSPAHST